MPCARPRSHSLRSAPRSAQAQREDGRNAGLGTLISQEVREQAHVRVEQARAAVAQAEVSLDSARLNLTRASVRAPTDGLVTNLDMRQGSYAMSGRPGWHWWTATSFYVEGYFEETKLPRIHTGDRVRVTTMGAGAALGGTVESFAAGIADRDRCTSANLLPSVNPTFNWVRLAQRVPVRVQLDPLPDGRSFVAGQTVTVQVIEESADRDGSTARPHHGYSTSPHHLPLGLCALSAATVLLGRRLRRSVRTTGSPTTPSPASPAAAARSMARSGTRSRTLGSGATLFAGTAAGALVAALQDPLLDRLVEQALAHNTDLRQAAANLERARAGGRSRWRATARRQL